jgi:hypothetical protein
MRPIALLVPVMALIFTGCMAGPPNLHGGENVNDNSIADTGGNGGTVPDSQGDTADDGAGDGTTDTGDTDTSGGDPPADSGTPDQPTSGLSEAQLNLAQMLARKQTRLMEAIAAFQIIDRAGIIPSTDGDFTVAGCPTITGNRTGNAVAMELNYGLTTTCADPLGTAGQFGGRVLVVLDYGTPNMVVTYENVTVNGHLIGGYIQSSSWSSTRSFNISANLFLEDEDTIDTSDLAIYGNVAVTINRALGVITVTSGSTLEREYLDQFECTLAGLVADPINNGNFVPEAGTVTTGYYVAEGSTEMDTFQVAFTAETPASKSVNVTINTDAPIATAIE